MPAVDRQQRDWRMIDMNTHKHTHKKTVCTYSLFLSLLTHTHTTDLVEWALFARNDCAMCFLFFLLPYSWLMLRCLVCVCVCVCRNTNRVHSSHIHNNWWCGVIGDCSHNYCRQVSKWARGGAVQFFNWLAVDSLSCLYKYTNTHTHTITCMCTHSLGKISNR